MSWLGQRGLWKRTRVRARGRRQGSPSQWQPSHRERRRELLLAPGPRSCTEPASPVGSRQSGPPVDSTENTTFVRRRRQLPTAKTAERRHSFPSSHLLMRLGERPGPRAQGDQRPRSGAWRKGTRMPCAAHCGGSPVCPGHLPAGTKARGRNHLGAWNQELLPGEP